MRDKTVRRDGRWMRKGVNPCTSRLDLAQCKRQPISHRKCLKSEKDRTKQNTHPMFKGFTEDGPNRTLRNKFLGSEPQPSFFSRFPPMRSIRHLPQGTAGAVPCSSTTCDYAPVCGGIRAALGEADVLRGLLTGRPLQRLLNGGLQPGGPAPKTSRLGIDTCNNRASLRATWHRCATRRFRTTGISPPSAHRVETAYHGLRTIRRAKPSVACQQQEGDA